MSIPIRIRSIREGLKEYFTTKSSWNIFHGHSIDFHILYKSLPSISNAEIDNYCIPMFLSKNSLIFFWKTSFEKFLAWDMIFSRFQLIFSKVSIEALRASGSWGLKKIPVSHSMILSVAPHFPYAIIGVPSDIASTGTSPKSSSGGKRNAFAWVMRTFFSSLLTRNFHSIFGFDFSLSSW